MNYRLVTVGALVAISALTGCRAGTAASYEACRYDSDCSRPSDTCVQIDSASSGAVVSICSSACTFGGTACPTDRFGAIGSCVSFNGGSLFQCYQTCTSSAQCETGLACMSETGGGSSTNICIVPSSSSGSLSYQNCRLDSDCIRSSDQCTELVSASTGANVNICSSACTFGGAACPADASGAIGSCVSFNAGASFQCYQTCTNSSQCAAGLACMTETGGSTTNICIVPSASGGTVPAYAGCAEGMTCQAGTSCLSVKDASTLELCTVAHCTSDADCPLDRRGGRGACFTLDGDSFSTCVERCTTISDCTYGSSNTEACVTRTANGTPLAVPACLPN